MTQWDMLQIKADMVPGGFPPFSRETRAEMASLGLPSRRLPVVPITIGLLALMVIGSAISTLASL
jgi:hypothetical protein